MQQKERFVKWEPISDLRRQLDTPVLTSHYEHGFQLTLVEPRADGRAFDSEWVEWFHDQTLGIYRDWRVQHFMFVGEDVIEVLSTTEPRIAEVKRGSSFGWR